MKAEKQKNLPFPLKNVNSGPEDISSMDRVNFVMCVHTVHACHHLSRDPVIYGQAYFGSPVLLSMPTDDPWTCFVCVRVSGEGACIAVLGE